MQAPNANVHPQRWVGSVRRERVLLVAGCHLDHVPRVYAPA